MFGRKKNGNECDTRIVLKKEEEIRKLEYARQDVIRELERKMKEYADIVAASKSEKKLLTEREGGEVGKAANDFKDFK